MQGREKLSVRYRPLSELVPYARNARTHSEVQVAQIAGSIREFGFTNPVLVDAEGGIIAGHGRVLAAHKLELTEVPTITLMGLSETQKRAYVLADNRLALNAGWDLEMLQVELDSLQADGFDLGLTGWSSEEIEQLVKDLLKQGGAGDDKEVIEDEAPEPPRVPVTKLGDVWKLGAHRLLCGDSTKAESWARILDDGERFDLVFTDPPYGVDYVGKTKDKLEVHNDGAEGLSALLNGAFDSVLARCRPGAVWYVCAPSGPHMHAFGTALSERGLWRQSIVWVKDVFVLGHSDYHYQQEQIFYGWTEGRHRPPPDRKQTTVWQFERPKTSREHPTMKPVKLVAHALGMSSVKSEIVGDPFAGSGTTLVAAEHLGRRCRTIELSPAYCDVVVERWQALSGGKAERRVS